MGTINWVFFGNLLFCAMVFIGLSVPLLKDAIPPNSLMGFRLRKAFKSRENWYRINRYGAKRMILWSLLLIVLAFGALLVPFQKSSGEASMPLVWFFSLAPLIIIVPGIETVLFARKL